MEQRIKTIEQELRLFRICFLTMTTLFGLAWFSGFTNPPEKQKLGEIDVERINIVEKDGKLKMVISNSERQHPGRMDGVSFPRQRPPGILFFNDIGDECGGLIFDGSQKDGQFAVVSFDKFREDQTIQLRHIEEADGNYFAGLTVWERLNSPAAERMKRGQEIRQMPEGTEKRAALKSFIEAGSWGFERVSVGKTYNQTAAVTLSDRKGRARINLAVDSTGNAKLEFLDEKGNVTYRIPQ
jgi:hypothetical protein